MNKRHFFQVSSERERSRLEVARVSTEKETLEVTLERREKELKAKREEFKKELVRFIFFLLYR